MNLKLDPNKDGEDHINVYSKGKTELGRLLSNFTKCDLDLPEGKFKSVEAYWYYLGCTHERKEELKNTYGWNAKKLGRELNSLDWQDGEEFQDKIRNAIELKVFKNERLQKLLQESKLPFVHYYNYGDKVIEPKEGKWVINYIEYIREVLHNSL